MTHEKALNAIQALWMKRDGGFFIHHRIDASVVLDTLEILGLIKFDEPKTVEQEAVEQEAVEVLRQLDIVFTDGGGRRSLGKILGPPSILGELLNAGFKIVRRGCASPVIGDDGKCGCSECSRQRLDATERTIHDR